MPHSHARLVDLIRREGVRDPAVLEALAAVDRANFVPQEAVDRAYADTPVPIPEQQTTSQPSLIARMVAAARVPRDSVVLEVGTGYGYQTALLAHLARRVVSVERHEVLAVTAQENLARAGIGNVEVVVGDGWLGHPKDAPYGAIVVSAAAARVPDPLGEQLAEGGRLVIPLRRPGSDDVWVFMKRSGALEPERFVTPARFVPLIEGDE